MGYEANYAGTSFLAPPEELPRQVPLRPRLHERAGRPLGAGSLSQTGWDDEGVAPDDFMIVKDGIFNDYQTTREQAMWLDWWYKQRRAAHALARLLVRAVLGRRAVPAHAERVAHAGRAGSQCGTISSPPPTDGIAIVGDGSFSIDQQRYNAQFGGQLFYEIRRREDHRHAQGRRYQMRTPEFWNAMDMIGGQRSYMLGGAFNDGKGQPSQSNAVSHGCPADAAPQINVINTGRTREPPEVALPQSQRAVPLARGGAAPLRSRRSASPPPMRRASPSTAARGQYALRRESDLDRRRQLQRHRHCPQPSSVEAGGAVRHHQSRWTTSRSRGGERRALSRLAPEDPELMPELGPQEYRERPSGTETPPPWSPRRVPRPSGDHRAGARADLDLDGVSSCPQAGAFAIANSKGLFAYSGLLSVALTTTVRTPDGTGSGWAGARTTTSAALMPPPLARVAIEKAQRSRDPVAIEPGRYTVVLEPTAVGESRAADRGFAQAQCPCGRRRTLVLLQAGGGNKIGEKVVDERVTIVSDPQ
jgi:hypothetical protein